MLWKDFPGHPVVRSPPANAEHTSSVPGLEGFHRPGEAAEPMHCGTHEPQLLKPTHPRACAPQQEKPRSEEPSTTTRAYPHSPQLERAHALQQRPSTAKNKL